MTRPARVAIIGAGISGLAAAYHLNRQKRNHGLEVEVSVLEHAGRLGGVIRTEQDGGFLLEAGPEAFVSSKPAILQLVAEIGLLGELIGSNDALRRTYVVDQKRLHLLPDGMAFLGPVRLRALWNNSLVSRRGKLRALLEPFVTRSQGDPSVSSFLQRRLGRELAEKVAEPLVASIYGGDWRRLSSPSALPETYRLEQRFGSLWKGLRAVSGNGLASGLPRFLTPRRGMAQLVERLAGSLDEVSIHHGLGEISIQPGANGYLVAGADFQGAFDVVLLCAPAPASAEVVKAVDPEAGHYLSQIPYTSTLVVFLAYRRAEFSHPLDGFGFVVPDKEASVLDACTWVSSKFPERCPPGHVLLRCAVHDGRRPRAPAPDWAWVEAAHRQVRRMLEISCAPVFSRVFHVGSAMPQLNVGHAEKLEQIRRSLARHPGLFLSGAFCGGAGVPDCVASAQKAAEGIVDFVLSGRRAGA